MQIGATSKSTRVYAVRVQLAIRSGATGLNSGLKAGKNIVRMRDDGIALALYRQEFSDTSVSVRRKFQSVLDVMKRAD